MAIQGCTPVPLRVSVAGWCSPSNLYLYLSQPYGKSVETQKAIESISSRATLTHSRSPGSSSVRRGWHFLPRPARQERSPTSYIILLTPTHQPTDAVPSRQNRRTRGEAKSVFLGHRAALFWLYFLAGLRRRSSVPDLSPRSIELAFLWKKPPHTELKPKLFHCSFLVSGVNHGTSFCTLAAQAGQAFEPCTIVCNWCALCEQFLRSKECALPFSHHQG